MEIINIMAKEEKLRVYNNPVKLQPIEGLCLQSTAGLTSTCLQDRGERSSSQFTGNVWSACQVLQSWLAF